MSNLTDDNPWLNLNWDSCTDYVLEEDKEAKKKGQTTVEDENDRSRSDKRRRNLNLRTSLFPLPFIGDIRNSEIYLLQANPGLTLAALSNNPVNKKIQECDSYRKNVQQCLKQKISQMEYPFYYLNPELWWLGGSAWWRNTLGDLIDSTCRRELQLTKDDNICEELNKNEKDEEYISSIYKKIANNLCAVEIHGYRSRNYRTPNGLRDDTGVGFSSSRFQARIVQKALEEDKLVIVMRAKNDWEELLRQCNFLEDGETLVRLRNCLTLSSPQNVTISENNLENKHGDNGGLLDRIVDRIVD